MLDIVRCGTVSSGSRVCIGIAGEQSRASALTHNLLVAEGGTLRPISVGWAARASPISRAVNVTRMVRPEEIGQLRRQYRHPTMVSKAGMMPSTGSPSAVMRPLMPLSSTLGRKACRRGWSDGADPARQARKLPRHADAAGLVTGAACVRPGRHRRRRRRSSPPASRQPKRTHHCTAPTRAAVEQWYCMSRPKHQMMSLLVCGT